MDKNFAGQNLNGRSFRGQDLRGADFSGCQLKSCDFREADLTGAKFCQTTMGINGQRNILKWVLAFILGIASGFFAWILNYLSVFALNEIYKTLTGADALAGENHDLLFIGSIFATISCLSVFAALKYRNWGIVGCYLLVIIMAGAIAGTLAGAAEGKEAGAEAVAAAAAGIGAVAAAVAAVAAGAGAGAVAAAVAVAVAVVVAVAGIGVGIGVIVTEGAVAAITFILLLLGWYLNRHTVQSEDQMLAVLRRNTLFFHCWGGTKFNDALLAHTDFTEANLTAARFAGAHFQQPNFTHAKNLHLAWTYASPLERKPVRTLLTEGRLDSQDFSNLNVRGLSFKGLALAGCNFYHTDLSEADFSGCDLTGANLSEAMVLGTRFSNATMTGAIIDNWSMDKHTQFDGVICDFVFTKRNKDERNPLDGTFFKPGEFSKLYQEIANTVDFIAHTPDELTALLRAIDSIKQQGGDIVIQSLERKNESVVVRTQSDESIDKAAIYAEVKAQTEKEWLVLQQEKQLLLQKVEMQEQQADTLKQFLKLAIESPKTMNDNSRHYSNITAQDAAVNLGDHSTVSNHIEQVADAELKAALQTLQHSHLPGIDKQQAHQAIDDLAASARNRRPSAKAWHGAVWLS